LIIGQAFPGSSITSLLSSDKCFVGVSLCQVEGRKGQEIGYMKSKLMKTIRQLFGDSEVADYSELSELSSDLI
jgi:hypothetical protein